MCSNLTSWGFFLSISLPYGCMSVRECMCCAVAAAAVDLKSNKEKSTELFARLLWSVLVKCFLLLLCVCVFVPVSSKNEKLKRWKCFACTISFIHLFKIHFDWHSKHKWAKKIYLIQLVTNLIFFLFYLFA